MSNDILLKEVTERVLENHKKISDLTVLSFGGGQDSTALLLLYIHSPKFRKQYAPKDFLVIMSDTGNEHQYTYDHVEYVKKLCLDNKIEFHFLEKGDIYHTGAWPDLIAPQTRKKNSKYKRTMVQLGTKSCTDKLKLGPIYKFIDEWINEKYYKSEFKINTTRGCRKKAIRAFTTDHGSIRMIIGFAFKEEKRALSCRRVEVKKIGGGDWDEKILKSFPLIDLEMDRDKCQAYIEKKIGYCPMPSNCMLCPYMSPAELVWLYRNDKKMFNLWKRIEKNKLSHDAELGVEKNNGVFASKLTIQDKLKKALIKYGDWDDEKLNHYKNNHGCGSSAY